MERDRAALVALLYAVSAGVSAAALRSTDLAGELSPPTELSQTSGESLLFVFLRWLFSVLGMSMSEFRMPSAGGGVLRLLLALFRTVESYLLPIAVGAVVVTALGLATRRIASGTSGTTATDDEATERDGVQFRPEELSNEVYRAWGEMVRKLDAENARARTPAEWAGVAREAGFDAEFVDEITDSFRAVRYGDEPVGPEQRRWNRRDSEGAEGDTER
ncbi:DUF4129 domain-containing protein [Halorussus limi]|uniref:DUF4129 domain-containing protein n=1 Tax=Halorussus limi TaxID=2938695 RepID=A0A8U0HY25_9EURY|nr:DUF4129 domain-containing protein [Halorussus limi]UPV75611.1 DUF4129 domain-containing protein [Halorussus limi]